MLEKIKAIFFIGYPSEEYELLTPGLLRESRRIFKSQIKMAVSLSLIVQFIEIMLSLNGNLINSGSVKNMYGVCIVAMIVSLLGFFVRPACGIVFVYYAATFVYRFIVPMPTFMLILYIAAAYMEFKAFFAHKHLKLIAKCGNIDNLDVLKYVAKNEGNVQGALQMLLDSKIEDNDISNEKTERFREAFGLNDGDAESNPMSNWAAMSTMDSKTFNEEINTNKKDFSVESLKHRFDEITESFGGQRSDKKSRGEWYSYMGNEDNNDNCLK